MSCNGCRVLRKRCSENCALRPCLQWIDTPEAQGNATVFVAKFFGRAGLMEFISAVPESERTGLFQSLLYEACGRTVNPVYGAIGLLWSGNWHLCQEAVETVLKGGTIRPLSSTFMAMSSNLSRNLSTKLRLASNSRERTPAAQQLPSLPAESESASSFASGKLQSSQSKRTLDELYKRETGQDLLKPSECKQHRPESRGDTPKRNMEFGTIVQQPNKAHPPTFFCDSNPPILHPGVSFVAIPAVSNSPLRDTQIHRLAPMTVFKARHRSDDHEKDINCPRRTRGDLPFIHEAVSSESCENLELRLTLNSVRLQSGRSGGTTESRAESTRVSSPSTISFNSEGSVTDIGSSGFPISSCSGHHLGLRPWKESDQKLLDLLV